MSVVRTGSGHYPGSRVDHAARWGVGPALDGLFSQSNLGIVTELGFWLQPRPASALVGYFTVPDTGLEFGVDLLRPFRIRGVLPVLNLYLVSGRDGAPMWFGIVGVYGSAKAVAVQREELEAACAQPATIAFLSPMDAEDPAARRATLEALGLPSTPFFDELLRGSSGLLTGEAVEFPPDAVLTYLGGAAVQHPTGPPRSIDPLDHDYGFYFLWPTCPALGREVRALLDLVRRPLAAHGFPPLFALKFVNGRAIVLVMRIAFDRKLAERRAAARACYRAIVDATIAAGYPPARMGIDGMDRLDPAGDTYWQLVRRLKGCLDPEGILAPGRYLPPEPQVFPDV